MVEVIHLTKRYRGLTLTAGGTAKESLVALNGESTLFISRADAAGLYEAVTGIVLN